MEKELGFILFSYRSIFPSVDNRHHYYIPKYLLIFIKRKKNAFVLSDGNCIHMVENGIVEKLMDLLDRHVEDGNVTVQHAALSALRNLAIPGKT